MSARKHTEGKNKLREKEKVAGVSVGSSQGVTISDER